MTRAPQKKEFTMQGPEGVGEYILRRSRRAKRVLLKLTAAQGLTVVAPWGLDLALVPGILERRKDWIEQTRAKQNRLREMAGVAAGSYPEVIVFQALEKRWPVEYIRGPGPGARVVDRTNSLEITAPGWQSAAAALRAFGKATARRCLTPLFARLAEKYNLVAPRVSIRSQRSRWGSCSSRGNVNLNWKLLFLPPELSRYVLLHELAHTIHMNHSPRYWEQLIAWEPGARELDRRLRHGWAHVPDWAEDSDR